MQMCRGLSPQERAQFGIPEGDRGVAAFAYLANSGCMSIPGTDDARDFQDVKAAMVTVGINAAGQSQIWQLLSGADRPQRDGHFCSRTKSKEQEDALRLP